MIYFVGIGINSSHLTCKIKEIIKSAEVIIIESYTSFFEDFKEIFKLIKGKEVIKADRKFFEEKLLDFLINNKNKEIVILIFGDVFFATTHISIVNELKKKNISFKIINNVSVLNLISNLGFSLYKFGKTISIPFLIRDKRIKIETPIKVIKENLKINAHTLVLLDLDPLNNDFLKAEEALEFLLNNDIKSNVVLCSRLGWEDEEIYFIKNLDKKVIKKIEEKNLKPPICIVVLSELNEIEKESLSFIEKV